MCPFAGSCEVNKAQRRHCPACRWQKCLDAGMKKDSELAPYHPKNLLCPPLTMLCPCSHSIILHMEDRVSFLKRARQCHYLLKISKV